MQVDSLLYSMGPQSEAIFTQLDHSPAKSTSYKNVIKKFDEYFAKKIYTIVEHAQLNQRIQGENESVEDFITTLYAMADKCGFSAGVKSEAIRDRIVSGIKDKTLSKEMQLKPNLTLAAAIEMARQHQLVTAQMQKLTVSAQIDENRKPRRKFSHKPPQRRDREPPPSDNRNKCMRCGRSHNRNKVCAAASATCRFCHRVGHYEVVCRRKNRQAKETSEILAPQPEYQHVNTAPQALSPVYSSDPLFMGEVNTQTSTDRPRFAQISINGENINFKIDSGADVSVMSRAQYERLRNPPKLVPSDCPLKAYGGTPESIGMFRVCTPVEFWIYVVEGDGSNLLSRRTSLEMNLIKFNEDKCIYELSSVKCNPVKITLTEGAVPYHVNVARRVPVPLQDRVQKELDRMEKQGVIERITEPTDWCAPMVVVAKKNNDVRICVDLKGLNKYIKREQFMLPTFEDIAPKLAGSAIFSKLDAASGYWQLPLDPDSAKLTTFITPNGRYCFRRLPFGICSASEIFQREMNSILVGIDGVVAYQDDVIVHGRDQHEHDQRLAQVLQKVKDAGLALNESKCEYSKTTITFLGHVVSKQGIAPDPSKTKAIRDIKPPTNVSRLRSFLGMVQYLGRFVHNLADVLQPLNDLLREGVQYQWTHKQQESFNRVKNLVTTAPVLMFFDPAKETIVSADASSYGIGGFVMQRQPD